MLRPPWRPDDCGFKTDRFLYANPGYTVLSAIGHLVDNFHFVICQNGNMVRVASTQAHWKSGSEYDHMSDKTPQSMAGFASACTFNREIQALLSTNPSAPDLARVIKSYAFGQIMASSPSAHSFMVTLLDTIDWVMLAEQVLASHLHMIHEPAHGRRSSLTTPF